MWSMFVGAAAVAAGLQADLSAGLRLGRLRRGPTIPIPITMARVTTDRRRLMDRLRDRSMPSRMWIRMVRAGNAGSRPTRIAVLAITVRAELKFYHDWNLREA